MTPPYIDPTLHIHSTFAAAKDFYDTFGTYHFWSGKTPATVAQVAQGKRNLIVGEPGIGKTELLRHIENRLKKDGLATYRIALKDVDAATKIIELLNTNQPQTRA